MSATNHAAAFCDDDDFPQRRSAPKLPRATPAPGAEALPTPLPTSASIPVHIPVLSPLPSPLPTLVPAPVPTLVPAPVPTRVQKIVPTPFPTSPLRAQTLAPQTLSLAVKRPREELVGNEVQQQKLRSALLSHPPVLTFLHGPNGCGKTTILCHAIQACGFVLWPWHSSPTHGAADFLQQVSEQCPLIVEKRALVFETNEIDIDAVVRILSRKKVPYPIFFVDDDEYNSKITALKKICGLTIKLFPLSRAIIETHLVGLGCERRVASEIVEAANGNAKKAVNEYEFLRRVSPKLTESFANYDRPRDLFGDTRLICSGIFEEPFAVESATSDADRAVLMVHENLRMLSPVLSESYSYADLMMNPRFQENLNVKAALEIVFRRATLCVRTLADRRFSASLVYCHDFYKTLASRSARIRHLARASIDSEVFPNKKSTDFSKKIKVVVLPDACTLSRARPRGIEAIERLQVFRASVSALSKESAALKKAGLWIYDDLEANKLRRS